MNKRALKTAVGLMRFLALILVVSMASGAGQPRIKFKEVVKNFGRVKQGDILSHEFVFTNAGDSMLTIQKVTTSCGCAAALASEDKVAPGKEGKISVKFITAGYGGVVGKYIFVESNDPAEPRKQLEVQANIEVPPSAKIEVNPYNFDGGLLLEGDELKVPLKIMNKGELELRAEFVHKTASYFIGGKPASLPLRLAARKEVEMEVRIPSPNKLGIARDFILIKSNDPTRSSVSIFITSYIITKAQLKEIFAKYKDILR